MPVHSPDWKATAEKLRQWWSVRNRSDLPADPWAVDALQGTAWEDRWRGDLLSYMLDTRYLPVVVQRTIKRLETCPKADWSGCSIPLYIGGCKIGLGTYRWKYDLELIEQAIDFGMRLIDTAESYGYGKAETELGKLSNISRAFIATKVARNHMSQGAVMNAAYRSLARLNLRSLYLYQIHWPSAVIPLEDTIQSFNRLWREKKIDNVGVCNFSADMIERAQANLETPVRTLQVRINALDTTANNVLIPFAKARGLRVIAYSPLCQDVKLLKKAGIGVKQAIEFLTKQDIVPIPQTNRKEHLEELLCMT